MQQAHIVYLHSHDTGRYIQPYGYDVETPNLQQFAEEGVLFRQAFCVAPTCSPSRAGLLTGTCPHRNGMIGLAHRGARLRDNSQHLAAFLARQGYATALSGFQHEITGAPEELGYQEVFTGGAGEEYPEWELSVARAAGDYLRRPHDRPFFLSCGFVTTHRMGPSPQWFNGEASPVGDPRYCRPPGPLPDLPEIRRDFADFRVAAARLDSYMGMVLAALEEAGLGENTLVICTTDHGIAFPSMKCNLNDHGLGVMLMLRGPGFTGGQVSDALVSHLDFFPTVCELAGLPAPDWLEGRSLLPLMRGETPTLHEELFSEVNYHAAPEPLRSVRTERYRYVRRFWPRPGPVLPNCDDSVSKHEMLRLGWGSCPRPAEELYDLAFDPLGSCNLAADPAQAEVLVDLRARLERWMRSTEDPLLKGRLDPWPGMRLTPADCQSPREEPLPAEPIIVAGDQGGPRSAPPEGPPE